MQAKSVFLAVVVFAVGVVFSADSMLARAAPESSFGVSAAEYSADRSAADGALPAPSSFAGVNVAPAGKAESETIFARRLFERLTSSSLFGYRGAADFAEEVEEDGFGDGLASYRGRAADAVVRAATDAATGDLRALAAGTWIKDLEWSFAPGFYGSRRLSARGSASLWESEGKLLFAQFGGDAREDENSARAGMGFRMMLSDSALVGIGAFSDYLDDDEHGAFRRRSWGAEVKTRRIDLSANRYASPTAARAAVNDAGEAVKVYSAGGWDWEATGRLTDWLDVSARRYVWERLYEDDLRGYDYRLGLSPFAHMRLELRHDAPEDGGADWGAELRFDYRFGGGESLAAFFARPGERADGGDIWARRYEEMRREHRQKIIEEVIPRAVEEAVAVAAMDSDAGGLYDAARAGNLVAVNDLIEAGADVHAVDDSGKTALHHIAESSQGEAAAVIVALLTAGADVNAQDDNGNTPLDLAADEKAAGTADALRARGGKCRRCSVEHENLSQSDRDQQIDYPAISLRASQAAANEGETAVLKIRVATPMVAAALKLTLERLTLGLDTGLTVATNGDWSFVEENCERANTNRCVVVLAEGTNEHTVGISVADDERAELAEQVVVAFANDAPSGYLFPTTSAARRFTVVISANDASEAVSSNGNTKLHIAARDGDLAAMDDWIEADANINAQNGKGEAPLHLAAANGQVEAVEKLFDDEVTGGGIRVNLQDNSGYSALIWAVRNGHADVVMALLDVAEDEIGVNLRDGEDYTALDWANRRNNEPIRSLLAEDEMVDARCNRKCRDGDMDVDGRVRMTAGLHTAAQRGDAAQISALLAMDDVDVNAKDKNGNTALIWAARRGRTEVVATLLAVDGIEINSQNSKRDTALDEASRGNWSSARNLLLAKKARCNSACRSGDIDLSGMQVPGDPVAEGRLRYFAKSGNDEEIEKLLEAGNINVNAADPGSGAAPALVLAAKHGYADVVRVLLTVDNIKVNATDSGNGATALIWAARNGHLTVVDELLADDRVRVNSQDSDGYTALIWAAQNGHSTVVDKLLADTDINVNSQSRYRRQTALMWAARNGHDAVVNELLTDNRVSVNLQDSNGYTALIWAVRNGHDAVVNELFDDDNINDNANVNLRDRYRQTALIWAARNGRANAAEWLLDEVGIEVNLRDSSGYTALIWAVRNRHADVVDKLLGGEVDINVNLRDSGLYRQPALIWAVQQNSANLVKKLVETNGIDVNLRGGLIGYTALILAAQNGYTAVIGELLQSSDIDVTLSGPHNGHTPLIKAVYESNPDAVDRLLEDQRVIDNINQLQTGGTYAGLTALDWAHNRHETSMRISLGEAGARCNLNCVRGNTRLDGTIVQ